ncbi:MAG: cyclic dehypoxanthinyl futalosine synthase [Syntrophobacterales bacterium]
MKAGAAHLEDKLTAGERLSREEARALWDLDLLTLGRLANRIRWRLHPEPRVTYVVDRNINYTNVCVSGCRFCAFYRTPGSPEGFVLEENTLRRKLEETQALGGSGVLLQGGLNPELSFNYYEDLVRFIRSFGLHVHGFSPPEIVFWARRHDLTINEVLERLLRAGLGSIPGGGAEILVDRVRQALSPHKCGAAAWLEVMAAAHQLGLRTTATMMFGHLETREERLEHLLRIRDLQDDTGGFTAFIPWSFQPQSTALGGEAVSSWEYLKTLAISRLVLDNIQNLQVSWVTQGAKIAQVALNFGANDFGSTMIEENVVAAAGVTFRLSESEINHLIITAGFEPQRRNHVYGLIGEGSQGSRTPSPIPHTSSFNPLNLSGPGKSGRKAPSSTASRGWEGGLGGGQGVAPPGPPPNSPSPSLAVIARVGAHRDFLEKGVTYLGGEEYDTPFGRSNPVHLFEHEGLVFAVLSRHGEEGYQVSAAFVNDRANLYALKNLGVQKILAWCAPGAVNEAMAPGHLVCPHDILDETRGEVYTFFAQRGLGFIRQNPVFCPELRRALSRTMQQGPLPWHPQGVYVATSGPRLETPAEIRKFRMLGGDLVGMTLVPEAFLARELELCYTALCYVVNFAEGIKERSFQPGVLFEGLATQEEVAQVLEVEGAFVDIVLRLLPELAAVPRSCPCGKLMERYRLRGDIGEDWRTWFK